jgi:hypothetical protein
MLVADGMGYMLQMLFRVIYGGHPEFERFTAARSTNARPA